MLKEQVARKLSLMDNSPFDDLKEHATGFNEQLYRLSENQGRVN